MQRAQIFNRLRYGKLQILPNKQKRTKRKVAFHLGQLARNFRSNGGKGEDVLNEEETHFCINMENDKTLALVDDKNVRYAEFVSGDDFMTMMVLVSGGPHA